MKEWLTAAEIAAEALPGMPASERGVQLLAERGCWDDTRSARRRAGRGGGMEYHFHLLPVLAQVAYTQKHMVVEAPAAKPNPTTETDLSARAAQERDARLAIVSAYSQFTRGLNLGHATHLQVFCDRYNVGMIQVADWVREIVPHVSKRSLIRWQSAKKHGKKLGFDPAAARKGTGVLETANGGKVRAYMLGLIAHQPHLSAAHVRTQCRAEFGDTITAISKGVEMVNPMPPVRTFQNTLKALKADHKVELIKLTNPDLYRSALAPSGVGMLRHVTQPNQLWQIDASPVDALCTDGRHSVYGCIDIATRRTTWLVSKTPRAAAVALLIRKAILKWGAPESVKTDNGSDFTARDTQRLFASLDIEAITSDAYSPEQKGHIERAIGTLQRDLAPELSGYVGHNVADRKAIEDRKSFAARLGESEAETFGVKLSGVELQKHIDDWAELIYERRPHAGLKGVTPHNAALMSAATIRTVDERALDLLLMPVAGTDGRRRVTKFGIRIDHHHYLTPMVLPGTDVFVRQDPHDLGRALVFAEDGGTFLGEAICPELRGIHPETFVKAAKEIHRELVDASTKSIKAEMRRIAKGPALIERSLDVARRDAPNVIALPKRTEEHSTAQIAAAIEAMSERPIRSAALDAAAQDRHRQLVAEFEAPPAADTKVTMLRQQETPAQRFARMIEIERRRERGDALTADEAYELGSYQQSAEYKTRKTILEDFGEQAPVMRT